MKPSRSDELTWGDTLCFAAGVLLATAVYGILSALRGCDWLRRWVMRSDR